MYNAYGVLFEKFIEFISPSVTFAMNNHIPLSHSSCCFQHKSNETNPIPHCNQNLAMSTSFSHRNKMIKILIPLMILFPFIICALYLPWGKVKYRLQTIQDVDSGILQNLQELIITEHNIEVRFDNCLGGICGEERDRLLCMVITGSRCERGSFQRHDKFNMTDFPFISKKKGSISAKSFDRLASFVVTVLSPYLHWTGRQKEAKNNMRYDEQVYISFRTTVVSMFLICTTMIFSIVSILAQIIQLFFNCSEPPSRTNKCISSINMTMDYLIEFCNTIASSLSVLVPVVYFCFTRRFLSSSNIIESYDAGFYTTLALGVAIFCGDLFSPNQTKKGIRK